MARKRYKPEEKIAKLRQVMFWSGTPGQRRPLTRTYNRALSGILNQQLDHIPGSGMISRISTHAPGI